MLTTRELAERLHVSMNTVKAMIRRGELPGARRIQSGSERSHWRIPETAVADWMAPVTVKKPNVSIIDSLDILKIR